MRSGEVIREEYVAQFSTNYPEIMDFRKQIYSAVSASRLDFIMDNAGGCLIRGLDLHGNQRSLF